MTAPLVTVLAVRIIRDLGYEPSILGLLLTTFGIGTVGGALLTARLSTRRHVGLVLLGGNLVTGATLLIVSVVIDVPLLLGISFVAGIAQSASSRSGCWSVPH